MIPKHWSTVFRQRSDQTVRLFTGVCYRGKKSAALCVATDDGPSTAMSQKNADTETGKPQQATGSWPIDSHFP